MSRDKAQPLDHSLLVRQIGQIVIALLGSAGFWYFGDASAAPTRVGVGAEILFWVCWAALIAMVITAVYPVALERQLRWMGAHLIAPYHGWMERREWETWADHWRRLTLLMLAVYDSDEFSRVADDKQRGYEQLRDWLRDNRHSLPTTAVKHVRWSLNRRFDTLTKNDQAIEESSGLIRFYRNPDLKRHLIDLVIDSVDSTWGKPQHRPETSLIAIWEGLSDFAISRRWPTLGRLELRPGT